LALVSKPDSKPEGQWPTARRPVWRNPKGKDGEKAGVPPDTIAVGKAPKANSETAIH